MILHAIICSPILIIFIGNILKIIDNAPHVIAHDAIGMIHIPIGMASIGNSPNVSIENGSPMIYAANDTANDVNMTYQHFDMNC